MGYLPESVKAQLSGQLVVASLFILLDFASEPVRLWQGDINIVREGHTWSSLAHASAQIDGITASIDGAATPLTITLSGVDTRFTRLAAAETAAGETEGREIRVWFGVFAADQPAGRLVPTDRLMHVGRWIMQRPEFAADGPKGRTVTIQAENRWVVKSRAMLGKLTDVDQQRRFPGDLGLQWIPALQQKTRRWPR